MSASTPDSELRSPSFAAAPAAAGANDVFCLAVWARPEPSVLPRLIELFAKRNLVPTRCVSAVVGTDELQVDLQLAGLDPDTGRYIARCVAQMVDVTEVVTSPR